MASLTVTAKGRVILRKEILLHLGVRPGDRIEIDLLPGRKVSIRPREPGNPMESLFGLLKKEGELPLTLQQIDEIIADGWANRR